MKPHFILLIFSLFYLHLSAQEKYADVFLDENLSALREGVDEDLIKEIKESPIREYALRLLKKPDLSKTRLQSYSSYLLPNLLAKKLKTTGYSQFENPTGIYFNQGDEIALWVNNPSNQLLKLKVANWDDQNFTLEEYPLKDGLNTFIAKNKGNSYIEYFVEDEDNRPAVHVHVFSGEENGVFDIKKHNNEDWKNILSNAKSPVIDILGEYTHLAYSVNSLKKYSPDNGVELVSLYDSIINIQHQIMGLTGANEVPRNRMFGRVIWRGFMHADGIGAAFHDNTMENVAHVENLRKNPWGVAHEFGHVNQVRPNMKWVGTTEVTNNIYSVWTQYLFNPESPKLEREKLQDYDEQKVGGRITSFMESAFIHRQPWLTQAGPDRWDRERPRDWGGDHFVKLVPLWQLQLYFVVAGESNHWENKNFYGEIFQKAMKAAPTPDKDDAYYQLEFIKNASDVAKLDLTDFFEQAGLLLPIDLWVDDYTCAQMTITEDQIASVKKYASKYKKPNTSVLHYITANSVDIYKNQEKLKGKSRKGFSLKDSKVIIDNDQWQGAVAFETYQGDKLIKIAFRGAGSLDNSKTIVHTPEGATTVKAVGWNGKRKNVISL